MSCRILGVDELSTIAATAVRQGARLRTVARWLAVLSAANAAAFVEEYRGRHGHPTAHGADDVARATVARVATGVFAKRDAKIQDAVQAAELLGALCYNSTVTMGGPIKGGSAATVCMRQLNRLMLRALQQKETG